MRMRYVVTGGALVAVAAMFAIPAIAGPSSPVSASDVAAAEATLLNGIIAQQQVLVPPGASMHTSQSAARSVITSASMRSAMKLAASTKLHKYYTAAAYTYAQKTATSGINAQSDPTFRVLGGGADMFNVLTETAVDSSTLNLTGTVRTRSDIAQLQGTTLVPADPTNILDFNAVMIKQTDGSWLISSYSWTFHPGSEP